MVNIDLVKCLIAAGALTIGLSGYAVAQEAVHRHRPHNRHHTVQPGPSPDEVGPSVFWSPAGGNPVHYAQTSGFYAGR